MKIGFKKSVAMVPVLGCCISCRAVAVHCRRGDGGQRALPISVQGFSVASYHRKIDFRKSGPTLPVLGRYISRDAVVLHCFRGASSEKC